MDGALNNASGATVSFLNSVGTFNSAVINSGAWITDPTTNVFNNTFTVTSSGSISAAAGDVYIFRQNFVNQSLQSNTWDTLNATLDTTTTGDAGLGTKFLFEGDGGISTQQYFHTGLTLTGGFIGLAAGNMDIQAVTSLSNVSGFKTNFTLGTLELTNTTLQLSQAYPTALTNNALFVKSLFLFDASELIISNNKRVYFINSNDWSLVGANVTLLGNAEIHQLISLNVVPEPQVLFLWVSGFATIFAARRRNRKR